MVGNAKSSSQSLVLLVGTICRLIRTDPSRRNKETDPFSVMATNKESSVFEDNKTILEDKSVFQVAVVDFPECDQPQMQFP